MSYTAGEALILTALRTVTGFTSTNTSRGNWQLLSKGTSDHYGIIRLGTASVTFVTVDRFHATYNTVIELWQRYTDDGTSLTNLYEDLGNVLTTLQPVHRILDITGGVIDAMIVAISEPEEMWQSGGGPAWLRLMITYQWIEEGTG